jgi:hypothetical protein
LRSTPNSSRILRRISPLGTLPFSYCCHVLMWIPRRFAHSRWVKWPRTCLNRSLSCAIEFSLNALFAQKNNYVYAILFQILILFIYKKR